MSFLVALSELIILPKYVKSSTLSSGMESTVMEGAIGVLLMNMVCVLIVLMLRPVFLAKLFNLSSLSYCSMQILWARGENSQIICKVQVF